MRTAPSAAGQDYYLKPMNAHAPPDLPSRGRSYRELHCGCSSSHRLPAYEKSGVGARLDRVRGMTQDDAHIYCTREQLRDELASLTPLRAGSLGRLRLNDFYLELSTKDRRSTSARRGVGRSDRDSE